MTFAEKVVYAHEKMIPVNLKLSDGIICVGVHIVDCSCDYIEIDPSEEQIRKCKEQGRDRICVLFYDEIDEIEFAGNPEAYPDDHPDA